MPIPTDRHDVEEASTLGLNGWPLTLQYNGHLYTRRTIQRDREGDVTVVLYRDDDGRELDVLND